MRGSCFVAPDWEERVRAMVASMPRTIEVVVVDADRPPAPAAHGGR